MFELNQPSPAQEKSETSEFDSTKLFPELSAEFIESNLERLQEFGRAATRLQTIIHERLPIVAKNAVVTIIRGERTLTDIQDNSFLENLSLQIDHKFGIGKFGEEIQYGDFEKSWVNGRGGRHSEVDAHELAQIIRDHHFCKKEVERLGKGIFEEPLETATFWGAMQWQLDVIRRTQKEA